MSFQLSFSPESEDTNEAVVNQLRERWGERFVARFEMKVESSIMLIERTPFIYPVIDQNTELRRCVLTKIVRYYIGYLTRQC